MIFKMVYNVKNVHGRDAEEETFEIQSNLNSLTAQTAANTAAIAVLNATPPGLPKILVMHNNFTAVGNNVGFTVDANDGGILNLDATLNTIFSNNTGSTGYYLFCISLKLDPTDTSGNVNVIARHRILPGTPYDYYVHRAVYTGEDANTTINFSFTIKMGNTDQLFFTTTADLVTDSGYSTITRLL